MPNHVLPPYPSAGRLDLEERLHGHRVADPFRWLEDPADPATRSWSEAQHRLWSAWIADRPERDVLVERLTGLVPGYTGAPTVVGGRRFWTARTPGQDHAVLWVADEAGTRALVDPNALDPSGTTTLDGWAPSIEGDRLAYLCSTGGDEESVLRVVDVAGGSTLDGPVDRLRYSPLAWLPGGEELVYVRRLAPGQVPAGEEMYHRRVWRHRVGADPDGDLCLFGGGEGHGPTVEATAYLGVDVSHDGRRIAVTVSLGTAPRNELWTAALEATAGAPRWTPVLVDVDAAAWPAFDRRGALWIITDLDAPRRRLVRTDPDSPAPEAWQEVVAEDPDGAVLESFVLAGDDLVVLRSRHALSEVAVLDRATGAHRHDVTLPGPGSADLTGRPDEGPEAWIGWTGYAAPYTVGRLDPAAGVVDIHPPDVGAPVVSHQRVFTSADGTEVRMTVIAPSLTPDRPRPTVLYGYGGFNVALTPAYSSTALAWVAAGGVWAVANLRGGSEEGEAWHRAGMREHKQAVFEDFEAAAADLVEHGWTTPGALGILGGSNGGLLVGAALTRRPDAYRAVVCSAPLLDMVRYESFGLGATWSDEYGSAADPTELGWLLGYSPYHHVEPGTVYPAVLFTVFDGDSRVDPLHARKMAAALQAASAGDPAQRPVLLRAEADVGHGARSVRRSVELAADELVFLAVHLGLDLPGR